MLIGISGMISSGKSTLSKKLVSHFPNSLLLNEYEEDDTVFNTYLSWFYEQKPNIDVSFQVYVVENHTAQVNKLRDKFKQLNLDPNQNIMFLDRFSAEHYVFAQVNLKNLPKKSFKAYKALFKEMISSEELPEFTIFLDVSFENFKNRLFKRGRDVEINNYELNEAYFKELHSVYKDTFIEVAKNLGIEYKIIDTNDKNEEEVYQQALSLIEEYKARRY